MSGSLLRPVVDPIRGLATRIERTGERLARGARRATVGTAPPPSPTPRVEVWRRDKIRLYRYSAPEHLEPTPRDVPPVLFVMSLVTTAVVFDLQRGNSLIERFLADGHDVFLLDWGVPDAVEAQNTLETYCDEYLPRAVEATLRVSGAEELSVFGYCLGAVLTLLSVAGHTAMPLRALMLLATPVDLVALGPLTSMLHARQIEVDDLLDWTGNVPAQRLEESFHLIEPAGEVTTVLSLWNSLGDPQRLAAHDVMVRWSKGHIPFPGACFRQLVDLMVLDDTLVRGEVPLGGRVVRLADIDVPAVSITGTRDTLVPAASSEPLDLPRLEHLELGAGHAGMIVGRKAHGELIPSILEWLARQ